MKFIKINAAPRIKMNNPTDFKNVLLIILHFYYNQFLNNCYFI